MLHEGTWIQTNVIENLESVSSKFSADGPYWNDDIITGQLK